MDIKKRKKISIIVIVCVILVLTIVSIIISSGNKYDYKNNTYIFNTIEDLDFLEDNIVENDIKDDNLENLSYVSKKTVQIKYDGEAYKLFAYEFNSMEDVYIYVKRVIGTDLKTISEEFGRNDWHSSKSYAIIFIPIYRKDCVIKDTNVLYIEANGVSNKKLNKFFDYLFTNLPIKVDVIA